MRRAAELWNVNYAIGSIVYMQGTRDEENTDADVYIYTELPFKAAVCWRQF